MFYRSLWLLVLLLLPASLFSMSAQDRTFNNHITAMKANPAQTPSIVADYDAEMTYMLLCRLLVADYAFNDAKKTKITLAKSCFGLKVKTPVLPGILEARLEVLDHNSFDYAKAYVAYQLLLKLKVVTAAAQAQTIPLPLDALDDLAVMGASLKDKIPSSED